MFKRPQFSVLQSRIEEPRRFIQVLSGPRQVGKSTVVKQVLKEISIPHLLFTADNESPENTAWIGEVWAAARARMQLLQSPEFLLVIDEVHKIDNWSEAVKKEWDSDSFNDIPLKVVLLGSSRLLLKDGLTETLAGRFELIRMPHWSFAEMREAFGFDLNQFIYYGGYPGGASLIKDHRRWQHYILDSIVAPAIERNVLSTKMVYKPALMQQFRPWLCLFGHGAFSQQDAWAVARCGQCDHTRQLPEHVGRGRIALWIAKIRQGHGKKIQLGTETDGLQYRAFFGAIGNEIRDRFHDSQSLGTLG